jgi:2-aminobenzoate-CoA ligase
LLSHAEIVECAVIGAPDHERGEVVQAHVVLKPGVERSPETAKRLQDHVKATITPYTGKIQRFKLKGETRL